MLIRSAGPAAQYLVARELKINFPAPRTVGVPAPWRNISWRKSWRSISLSHDGLERPVQCVSYITAHLDREPIDVR